MTSIEQAPHIDSYLEGVKGGRKSTSVLKLKLVTYRSAEPKKLVFVFEGIDDKIIYYSWISRISQSLEYEPFPCDSKYEVLKFREMLKRDLNGLANGVYYFIDRDFDDDMGFGNDPSQFVTDCYSVENYLVCETVLDRILTNEFHCHAKPEVRKAIIDRFTEAYERFLSVSAEINYQVFIARKLKLDIGKIPGAASFAEISVEAVKQKAAGPDVIRLPREITEAEQSTLQKEFSGLEPRSRYRGKFAYWFLKQWIELLASDYRKYEPLLFAGIEGTAKARQGELSLGNLAGKSPLPFGLGEFIKNAEREASVG